MRTKARGFGPYKLPSMNPIYLAYLKAHGLTEEPALYKFVIWAHQRADEYRKAFNLPIITDHNHYAEWVKAGK